MREEKNFLQKNKDTKNNLYIRNIPKTKQPRELYEYFLKFGDVFSLKVNENDKGEFTGTAFLTYYKEDKPCPKNVKPLAAFLAFLNIFGFYTLKILEIFKSKLFTEHIFI